MTRNWIALALLLALLPAAGCGKEVVVGGQKDVDTYATGDGTPEGGASGSLAPRYAAAPAGPHFTHIAGRAQGTLTFDARVTLVGTGGPAALNAAPATATVRIDGHDTTRVVQGRVRAARYTTVRVTFTRVQANVTGGLMIGGVNVTGLVNVGIAPGDSIVVEQAVDLGGASEDVALLVDLDASAWLAATNSVTRIVSPTAFQSAVKLRRLDRS